MQCKCGYSFARALAEDDFAHEHYAVVNDRVYQPFLRAEIKVLKCKRDQRRKMQAMQHSLRYVGNMSECPECGLIAWSKPGAGEVQYYRLEA